MALTRTSLPEVTQVAVAWPGWLNSQPGPLPPHHTASCPELLEKWPYPRMPLFCHQMKRAGWGSHLPSHCPRIRTCQLFPRSPPSPCSLCLAPAPPGTRGSFLRKAAPPLEVSRLNTRCLLSPSARQVSSPSRRTFSFQAIYFLRPDNRCRASLGPGPGPTLALPAMVSGPVSGVLCLPTACFIQTLDHNLWPTSHAYFRESAYSVNVGAAKPFEGRGEGDMLLTRSTIVTGLRFKA